MIGRRGKRRPRNGRAQLARELGRPRRSAAAQAAGRALDPASRCSASSSGSAETSRPARSSRPKTGRGSEGALATALPQALERGAIGRRGQQPGARCLDFARRSLRRTGRSPRRRRRFRAGRRFPRASPALSCARQRRPSRSSAMTCRASPDSSSSIAEFGRQRRRGGRAPRRRRLISPSLRGGKHQLVGKATGFIEKVDQRSRSARRCRAPRRAASRTCSDASASSRSAPGGAARGRELAAKPGGDGVDQRLGARRRQVVEGDEALAEAVAAAAAAEDQRHRRGGDRAIIVADQSLQHARLAAAAAGSRGGRRSALRRRGAEAAPSSRARRAGPQRSAPRPARHRLRRSRRARPLGSAARTASATSLTRQWSMAVISARSCSVRRLAGSRKKSRRTVASRPRPARRAGAFPSAAGAAIGHSSGIIAPALSDFS